MGFFFLLLLLVQLGDGSHLLQLLSPNQFTCSVPSFCSPFSSVPTLCSRWFFTDVVVMLSWENSGTNSGNMWRSLNVEPVEMRIQLRDAEYSSPLVFSCTAEWIVSVANLTLYLTFPFFSISCFVNSVIFLSFLFFFLLAFGIQKRQINILHSFWVSFLTGITFETTSVHVLNKNEMISDETGLNLIKFVTVRMTKIIWLC